METIQKKTSEAQTRANKKYSDKNMKMISVNLNKDVFELLEAWVLKSGNRSLLCNITIWMWITLRFNQGDIWLYCAYCIYLLCYIVNIALKMMMWLWISFRPVCCFWRVIMWYRRVFDAKKNENRMDWCYRMLWYLYCIM